MKKNTILIILFLLIIKIAKSQTCPNDTNIFLGPVLSIPAYGTAITGPFLDSLKPDLRTAGILYRVPISKNTTISSLLLQFTVNVPDPFPLNDSIGIVFYGPYSQNITNCSDLTQPNMLFFQNAKISIAMPVLISNTLAEGNYYYLLLTFKCPANVIDSVKSSMYLANPDSTFECNNKVSVIHQTNFCNLTIDTAVNHCRLTWQEFPNNNLQGYNVYKQDNLTGSYTFVANVPVSNLSEYLDITSSPASQSYKYAISAIDDCGNYYPIQASTKALSSIHLISYISNNQAQLIWNNIFQPGIYNSQYDIYRCDNSGVWSTIGQIGTALSTITYTDTNPPLGTSKYAIGLQFQSTCSPMRLSSPSANFQSSISNIVVSNNINTAIEQLTNNEWISIYPNPAADKFTIDLNSLNMSAVNISILDMRGNLCLEFKNVVEKSLILERKNLKPGIYIVEIKNGKVYRNKLVLN